MVEKSRRILLNFHDFEVPWGLQPQLAVAGLQRRIVRSRTCRTNKRDILSKDESDGLAPERRGALFLVKRAT